MDSSGGIVRKLTPVVALVAARIGRRTPLDLGRLGLGNGKILERLALLLELIEAVGEHSLLDLDEYNVNDRHFDDTFFGGRIRCLRVCG